GVALRIGVRDACRIAKVSEGRRNSDRGCGFSASSLLIHERDNLCLWKSHAPRIPLYRHTPQDENFRRKMNTSIPVYVCRYRGTVLREPHFSHLRCERLIATGVSVLNQPGSKDSFGH